MSITLSNVAMLVSVFLMVMFLCYAFFYSQERGIRYFAWVMACRVTYAGSVIMELNSESFAAKMLFRNIQQTSLLFVVPMMVFFVLALFDKNDYLRPKRMLQILSVFLAWSLLIWTNSYHHLLFWHAELNQGHLEVSKTAYSIAFHIICYLVISVCVFYLFIYLRRVRPELRKPGILLILCGCIPAAMEMVKSLNPSFTPWLLPLSVYCGFMGMAMLWLVIRYRMFSVVPLARNMVVETMEEGILIVNHRGIIIDTNIYVEPLLVTLDNSPITGQPIDKLLAHWPEWLYACKHMKTKDMEVNAEVNGESRVYSIKVYPVSPSQKAAQGTVSVVFDITDKHRQMEHIVKLNQLKDHLFAIVSHDIRNPLAVQASLIEVLEADKTLFRPQHQEVIDALNGQIQNTFVMIENLLEWFRSQKEGLLLQPERLRLADAVEEACYSLRIKSEAKQVAIDIDIDSHIDVYADREAVQLIVRNLITNSIKFSKRNGKIIVKAEAQGNQVIISVCDHGVGIEAERIGELFDPLKLVSTTGTAGERGTGLGLQVCQQFVRMSGGEIRVESVPNQKTVFYFSLNASDPERNQYERNAN
ncbi:His Kinase A (phospho-acceptor) domain-containing protein [Paenibacillus sp. UNCCL117]|uniref:sensor histidine kinase n=1 Tax=unclassified Paenibacillus TaxID=185978 RepID=UPI00088124B0|nr:MULTISPECIES: histidine kinase N-terminal 7TM domain-containing protein [unclassified Paenibacillus]SDE06281.1 His Kinase A (phospho-acceptor) domain-containing protein [Paenibacillus sp. cl123]SFW59467.1 His Kinase A (phospho-acceptor) domain-containing protein [Paenibacillus sp. UNCCL117]